MIPIGLTRRPVEGSARRSKHDRREQASSIFRRMGRVPLLGTVSTVVADRAGCRQVIGAKSDSAKVSDRAVHKKGRHSME